MWVKAKGGRIGLRDRVFAKGGTVGKKSPKSQGYKAREDESLGVRTGRIKKILRNNLGEGSST